MPRSEPATLPARSLIRAASARLSAAGVASPQVDAELLLAFVLDVGRGDLVLAGPPDPAAVRRFDELVRRRSDREPLQYLLGTAAFRHVVLEVGPGVFIPRPETELLIDAVLPELRRHDDPVAVDLCAGSGALALAIASEVPSALVTAVERSPSALAWLRRNVERCAPGGRVQVVQADVAAPDDLFGLTGVVDAVVCNPPYVPADMRVGPEVARDPAEALFAGMDGLELMPAVIRLAAALLKSGGVLAIEHDDSHGQTVPALLTDAARTWTDVVDHRDLAGRPRFVTARRA